MVTTPFYDPDNERQKVQPGDGTGHMSYPRRSSAHEPQAALEPQWGDRFGMTVPLCFTTPEDERTRLADLDA